MQRSTDLAARWCRRALVLLWLMHLPAAAGAQTCCVPRDTGGCGEMPACEACVCAFDDFCCDLEWDDTCAEAAALDCGELCQCELPPTPTPGASDDCCSEHPEPGCGLSACEDCLCAGDDYCCTVEWDDLCLDDVFDFCIDECQCLAVSTPTPTPTSPLSPSATADASPSSTPGVVSPTAEPTSSATAAPPTGTPVGTPTNAVPSATETPQGVASVTATAGTVPEDEVRYPRGDADCDAQLGADDVTATILALSGAVGCGNDDCNRDGDVGSDDIECVARCLFDACPVSPVAPVVLDVEPEIASTLASGSLIRITGSGLNSGDSLLTVAIGGRLASIVEATEDEILAVLPLLDAGPADLVVSRADVASRPFPLEVSDPAVIGSLDTFGATMALLDEALMRIADLELSEAFGGDASAVAAAVAERRLEIEALVDQIEAELSPEDQETLDALVESSGAPERLRRLLDDLEDLGDTNAALSGTVAVTPVVRGGAQTIRIVAGAAQTAGLVLSIPAASALAFGSALISGVLLAANEPVRPLIFDVELRDRFEIEQPYVAAGGSVTIRGARFDSFTTKLELRVGRGVFVRGGSAMGDGLRFEVPDAFGFCGPVTLVLTRALETSNPVTTRIQPELDSVVPANGDPGDSTTLETNGFTGCDGRVFYERGPSGRQGPLSRNVRYVVTQPDEGVLSLPIPNLVFGTYRVILDVAGLRTMPPDRTQRIDHAITGIDISCEDPKAPPDSGQRAFCVAKLLPGPTATEPFGSEITVSSSDTDVVTIEDPRRLIWFLRAHRPGQATISVDFVSRFDPDFVLNSDQITVTVEDVTRPTVELSLSDDRAEPGDSFEVTVRAEDNVELDEISLAVMGDAVESVTPQLTQSCAGSKICDRTFTVTLKETGITDAFILVSATASDTAGLSETTDGTAVAVDLDFACPDVTITQPLAGATVDPGSTVRVSASASDDESGVARFFYTASGPALVTQVSQELPLPQPQANPTLDFDLAIRSEQQLSNVVDRDIDITVEAEDAAGNVCGARTLEIRVSGGPDACGYSPDVARIGLRVVGSFDGEAGAEMLDFSIPVSGTFPGSVVNRAILYEASEEFFRDAEEIVRVERTVRFSGQLNDQCTKIDSFQYRHSEDVTNTRTGFATYDELSVGGTNVSTTSTGTISASFREEGLSVCNSIDSFSFEQGRGDEIVRTLLGYSCNESSLLTISLERERDR